MSEERAGMLFGLYLVVLCGLMILGNLPFWGLAILAVAGMTILNLFVKEARLPRPPRDVSPYDYEADYTQHLGVFAQPPFTKEAPYGHHDGRHIIGRDCRINGGVYFTGYGEILVVDDTKYRRELALVYRAILLQICVPFIAGRLSEQYVMRCVYRTVKQVLRYDLEYSSALAWRYDNKRVALNKCLRARRGVCRHQALLAAYVIERLINDGYMRGKVSIDRNRSYRGGHAWTRYTAPNGTAYVIDAAQKVCAEMSEAIATTGWNYRLGSEGGTGFYTPTPPHASV